MNVGEAHSTAVILGWLVELSAVSGVPIPEHVHAEAQKAAERAGKVLQVATTSLYSPPR